ncbi:hypothetical protein BEH_07210 [Priestia filamentosa]|uniref:Uncharacterized protein n=1 Tax=Priestia filamentosa TaxID=1402861 RepID=A0A0H4KUD5_9BACI|nr:hypothetical protein [Priestia filamentosa]AKO91908.1 hypothetical protein BEH_07210 [Priestia filamentosa]
MAKKQQQFSVSMLKPEVDFYKQTRDVTATLPDGTELPITFTPFFSPESIRELLIEIGKFFEKAQEENLDVDSMSQEDIVNCFILKHYTDMKFTTSKKAKTLFNLFEILVNSKLYSDILDVIPEESILSVKEAIFKIYESSIEQEELITQKLMEAQANMPELQNPELLDRLTKKDSDE